MGRLLAPPRAASSRSAVAPLFLGGLRGRRLRPRGFEVCNAAARRPRVPVRPRPSRLAALMAMLARRVWLARGLGAAVRRRRPLGGPLPLLPAARAFARARRPFLGFGRLASRAPRPPPLSSPARASPLRCPPRSRASGPSAAVGAFPLPRGLWGAAAVARGARPLAALPPPPGRCAVVWALLVGSV